MNSVLVFATVTLDNPVAHTWKKSACCRCTSRRIHRRLPPCLVSRLVSRASNMFAGTCTRRLRNIRRLFESLLSVNFYIVRCVRVSPREFLFLANGETSGRRELRVIGIRFIEIPSFTVALYGLERRYRVSSNLGTRFLFRRIKRLGRGKAIKAGIIAR